MLKNLSICFMTCSAVENDAAGNACWFQTTPPYGTYPGGGQITGRDGKPIKDAQIVFDEKSTDRIMEAFRAAVSAPGCPGILVDQDHFSCDTDKPTTALAWAKEIRRAEDGSLWTRWEFTAKGKELYEGKMLVNRSPVLMLEELKGGKVEKFHELFNHSTFQPFNFVYPVRARVDRHDEQAVFQRPVAARCGAGSQQQQRRNHGSENPGEARARRRRDAR